MGKKKSRDSYVRSKCLGSWILSNHWMTLRKKHVGFHRPDFREISYFRTCRKYIQKIQVSLKCDKNNEYCTWRLVDFMVISLSLWILLRMKNVSNFEEIFKRHILCSVSFFFLKIMSFVRWREKHRMYRCASTAKLVTRTRHYVPLYVYCLSC